MSHNGCELSMNYLPVGMLCTEINSTCVHLDHKDATVGLLHNKDTEKDTEITLVIAH